MRILAFVSSTKGSGKSVLAAHVAAAAAHTEDDPISLITVRADDTENAEGRLSGALGLATIEVGFGELSDRLKALDDVGIGTAVIDAPSTGDEAIEAVVACADLVAIPVSSRGKKEADLDETLAAVRALGKPFVFVANRVGSKGLSAQIVMALAQNGTICPVMVPNIPGLTAQNKRKSTADDGNETVDFDDIMARLWASLAEQLDAGTSQDPEVPEVSPGAGQRREFPRWPAKWPITLLLEDGETPARLQNISGGGVLISTEASLEVGGLIKLDVPDLGLLEATVLHSRDQQYGLAFTSSTEERSKLADQLDKIFAGGDRASPIEPLPEIVDEHPAESAEDQPTEAVQQSPEVVVAEDQPTEAVQQSPEVVVAEETHRVARSVIVSREAIQTTEVPLEIAAAGSDAIIRDLAARESGAQRPRGTIITVANPKGGSGKSTISMHLVSGLMRHGFTVATADLDPEQETLTRYLENRAAFAAEEDLDLPSPIHHSRFRSHVDDAVERELKHLTDIANVVVIDTAARISSLSQVAHALADILITPINDSFVDLDVLATIDPRTLEFKGASTYGQFITDIRTKKAETGLGDIDWIVMRNRLTNLDARNKRDMAEAVDDLASRLGFTVGSGLSERVIYRELFLHGLSLLDLRATNKPLTLSHVVARQELRSLLAGILAKIAVADCTKVA